MTTHRKSTPKVAPRRFELRWNRVSSEWMLYEGDRPGLHFFPKGIGKAEAESRAREHVRGLGVPATFRRKTKKGRIGKGGRAESSYFCDSPRRKG